MAAKCSGRCGVRPCVACRKAAKEVEAKGRRTPVEVLALPPSEFRFVEYLELLNLGISQWLAVPPELLEGTSPLVGSITYAQALSDMAHFNARMFGADQTEGV